MTKTRKGFTLVELLIVIVVIGILSAMVMLSSGEAVSSARASTIISNLRNLRTAALAYYEDNMDFFDNLNNKSTYNANGTLAATYFNELCQYLNGQEKIPDISDYYVHLRTGDNGGQSAWYVVYKADEIKGSEGDRIRKKIAGRAGSLGLVKASGALNNTYDGKGSGKEKYVALQIR